ncbi:unnamed protein product [Caenorhabditis angaria]|uniref:Major facilitator superfamily (MFS) profile domain-containing protein n=1 Tax=Caenorhabditis angaria TaxID=860376 RepID=A0A9P1J1N5_9PELO|nr:unnamed protein product [Caenorhabditis angaria]
MTEEADLKNEQKEDESRQILKFSTTRTNLSQDFGKYETRLLLITQLGYIPVAASMLLSTFAEPSEEYCKYLNSTNPPKNWKTNDFFSLSMEYGFFCDSSSITTLLSSLLMWGALIGSFCCGFVSDYVGRKPVFTGCLAMISLLNGVLCFSNFLTVYIIGFILLMLGFFSGGYMVTNFVILTEAFELPRSRLLVVSLNGWSFSMITTAFIAWSVLHWLPYHATISVIAFFMTIIAKSFSFESCRWLSSNGNYHSAKENAISIRSLNGSSLEIDDTSEMEWFEVLGFSKPIHINHGKRFIALFKDPELLKPTVVMFYCFLASSIVSFGFYFSLDVLPGNRFMNLAFMGLFKFILGFTPFLLSTYMTKRNIVILSISICCVAAVIIVPLQIVNISFLNFLISVMSLIVAAGMDPTWKINHLYSAELFPTSVRSMGRGVCNAGGRLGSVIAPMVTFLRTFDPVYPSAIFCILLIIQMTVVVLFLPNDNDERANEMDEE